MTDPIATEVKTDVTGEILSLKSRMLALESEAAGYVHAHWVYLVGAVCLVIGVIGGHIFK
jgi:hypothetical protein